jgi:heme-degrading monooxygenase HmoA
LRLIGYESLELLTDSRRIAVDLGGCKLVVVWEFRVRPGSEAEFEQAYGPGGVWVRLFSSDPAYRGTELVRDVAEPRRYLTMDSWTLAAAYEAFKRSHVAEYTAIDRECERLTEGENEIGRFMGLRG